MSSRSLWVLLHACMVLWNPRMHNRKAPPAGIKDPHNNCKAKQSSAPFLPWGVWLGPRQPSQRFHWPPNRLDRCALMHVHTHSIRWHSTREEPDPRLCLHGHVCVWIEVSAACVSLWLRAKLYCAYLASASGGGGVGGRGEYRLFTWLHSWFSLNAGTWIIFDELLLKAASRQVEKSGSGEE